MTTVRVELDRHSQEAIDYVLRTVGHGAPERVALSRAERKFSIERNYLRSLMRLTER